MTSGAAAIDRNSPLPLFLQIRQVLLSDIHAWRDRDRRFPTETALAARFGVSKMTVRQAVDELVARGLLDRRQGRGTFVTDAAFVERLTPSLDIDQQYEAAGQSMAIKVLSIITRPASTTESALLGLPSGATVMVLRRLRSLGGGPAAVDERVLPAALARKAGFTRRTVRDSLVGRLRRVTSLSRARWTMTAKRAGPDLGPLLVLAPDAPVLERAMKYFDPDGRILMFGRTVHRSDLSCEVELDLDVSVAAP